MARFRKKPIVIEAYQWLKVEDYVEGVKRDVDYYRAPGEDGELCQHCDLTKHSHGWINTLEGGHIVCPTDWIITGVKGEKYPCKADIFYSSYEKVED